MNDINKVLAGADQASSRGSSFELAPDQVHQISGAMQRPYPRDPLDPFGGPFPGPTFPPSPFPRNPYPIGF